MSTIVVLHWTYVAVMAAGAAWILWWSRNPKGVPSYEYVLHASIPIWSGTAYAAIAFELGSITVSGQTVYLARYLDWVVTTPLLLITLALTSMYYLERKRISIIVALVFADVLMILSGLLADVAGSPAAQWSFYGLGVVALGGILYGIWGPLRALAASQPHGLGKRYNALAAYHSILWVGYPLVWLAGPSGLGMTAEVTDVALFVALPILSKVGFSIFDLAVLRSLPGHDLAEHPELEASRA